MLSILSTTSNSHLCNWNVDILKGEKHMIIHVNDLQEFNEKVANGRVLVDFYASWCGPCKMLAPILEEVDAKGEAGDLLIVKVDVDEAMAIAGKFGIQSIPTLILFENGQVKATRLGYMPKAQLLSFLQLS